MQGPVSSDPTTTEQQHALKETNGKQVRAHACILVSAPEMPLAWAFVLVFRRGRLRNHWECTAKHLLHAGLAQLQHTLRFRPVGHHHHGLTCMLCQDLKQEDADA